MQKQQVDQGVFS